MATAKERMGAALKAARDISELAEREGRDLTPEENEKATAALLEYKEAKKDFERTQSTEQLKSALAEIGVDLGLEPAGAKAKPESFAAPRRLKSIGQMFAESAEYKGMMSQFADGRINEKARVQSAPMGVKALITGGSATSGGAFVDPDVQRDLELLGRRELTIRDLVSVRQTESDSVEFVRQTTQMTSAAVVAEATSAAGPSYEADTETGDVTVTLADGGGYKPEGAVAFERVTTPVKTIAEWVPATKRGLADAAQLRGLIDDELRADLAEEEEDQILNGNGSGENFTGILNTSGIQTQALVTDAITTIRKARTKVRTVGRVRANGVVLNPVDAEALDLAKGADQFYGPGPFATAGIRTIWGLPIVESEAIAEKTALVGDFSKAVIWDREQASITATDSHADFFIRNLVAILGEQREAFGVLRPKAFVKATIAS